MTGCFPEHTTYFAVPNREGRYSRARAFHLARSRNVLQRAGTLYDDSMTVPG